MTNRVLAKDVNVFAPQMLLWSVDTYGNEYDRAKMDAKLKHYVDPERIGIGSSGVTWQYLTVLMR